MGTSLAMAAPHSDPVSPRPPRPRNPGTGTYSNRHSRWGPVDADGYNPWMRRGTGGDGEFGASGGGGREGDGDGEEDDEEEEQLGIWGPQ